jgi:hypothetical protein
MPLYPPPMPVCFAGSGRWRLNCPVGVFKTRSWMLSRALISGSSITDGELVEIHNIVARWGNRLGSQPYRYLVSMKAYEMVMSDATTDGQDQLSTLQNLSDKNCELVTDVFTLYQTMSTKLRLGELQNPASVDSCAWHIHLQMAGKTSEAMSSLSSTSSIGGLVCYEQNYRVTRNIKVLTFLQCAVS